MGVVILVLGTLAMLVCAGDLLVQCISMNRWPRVTGRVIDWQRATDPDDHYPVLEYRTFDGKRIKVRAADPIRGFPKVGEDVSVIYNPRIPYRCNHLKALHRSWANFSVALVAALVGVTILLIVAL